MENMKVGVPHLLVVFLALLSFGCNGDVLPVPPLDITAKDLAQYLSLGDTDISFPALYVFGDSFLDAGNNNHLNPGKQIYKANFAPYGIDFGGKATGRVTNGRTAVDFIAQVAGLPFPPAMLGMTEAEKSSVRTGVNYASATGGVQPEPAAMMKDGDFLSLDEQVDLFEETTTKLRTQFQSAESFGEYLSKSIFFLHISSNDLAIYWMYLKGDYNNDPKAYNAHLLEVYSAQLKRLYNLGARKFFINNVTPLGCMPFIRYSNFFNLNGSCNEEQNTQISMYNQILADAIPELQSSLSGSKFVLFDFHTLISEVEARPASFGLKNITNGCCLGSEEHGIGPCKQDSVPCPDRSSYLFYDSNHFTEYVHFLWARRVLKDSSVSSPFNFIELIRT